MKVGLLDDAARRMLRDDFQQLEESARQQGQFNDTLVERIAELELALEDAGWLRLGDTSLEEFSREGLRRITRLARIFYLKNPLVQRGVNVQTHYVWAQGISIKAVDERINEVVQAFLDDEKNIVELTGHQARMTKEMELQTDGNLFFVLFPNQSDGTVRLRSIPFSEMDDVIRNPDDSMEPWYYKRTWMEQKFNTKTGTVVGGQKTAYYPDWQYNPRAAKLATIEAKPVMWDSPVYHVKVGGFSDWKFGVSEVYAALDWAKAYKEFLEDWASIVRSYRRFAWVYSGAKSTAEIAAVKGKMHTTYATAGGTSQETVPPPVTGAEAILREGRDLQPVKTAGATVAAEDGRQLKLMVCAATGLPETFFGDVSVGTLATAKSLDRPTELQMKSRQTLWADIYKDVLHYTLLWAVKAPSGPLRGLGRILEQIDDGNTVQTVEWNEGVDSQIDVAFPPLIEADVKEAVGAIVDAATLKGALDADTIPRQDLVRMLLTALGVDDVDEVIARLYSEGEEPELESAEIAAAVQGLREALEKAIDKYADTK